MFRSFDGQVSSKPKVDLRGRSRVEESREQVLERTRQERKRRQQQKLEQKSALQVQAFWRGRHAAKQLREAVRSSWLQNYCKGGKITDREAGLLSSPLYRDLCFFCRPENSADVELLVGACKLLTAHRDANGRALCCDVEQTHLSGKILLLRAKQVAFMCVQALVSHSSELQAVLHDKRQQSGPGSAACVASTAISTIEMLTDEQTWLPLGSSEAAAKAACTVPTNMLAQFLCIPLLWKRYPALKPLQAAIWQQAVKALHELGSDKQGQLDVPSSAVQFVRVAGWLMSVIPLQRLFDADDIMIDDEDMLHLSVQEPLASSLAAQIQCLAEAATLKPLISILLPVTPASAAAASLDAKNGRSPDASGVWKLLELLSAMLDMPALRQNTLIVLAVHAELVPRLWYSYLKAMHGASAWEPSRDEACDPGWMLPLVVFARTYSTFLSTFGDDYMYRLQKPLPLAELNQPGKTGGLVSLLKFALWQVLWAETSPASHGWTGRAAALRAKLKEAVGTLLGQLYNRNCRVQFAPPQAFQAEDLPPARFHTEVKVAAASVGGLMEAKHTRVWSILTHAPFLVPFEERARVFQTVISSDRLERREMGIYGSQSFTMIHRSSVFQDGFEKLNLPGEALRGRVRIQYMDTFGEIEAGVDGGGLFKDFMENLIKEGFDPRVGLFKATPDQKLYPNPAAATVEPNAFALFEFMGKMVGKALYEGILLEVPLAGFFLKKLLRRGCDLNDLPSLDAELYRSLLFLRDYDGDVEDLALTFTVTDSDFGTNREVELLPGSRERAVTNGNRLEYIHRVANFRLNVQIKRATDAFRKGLEDVIAREWITMFNEAELQALIGGGDHQGLDLEDMKQHVNYAGGYDTDHPVIMEFWRAMQEFTPEQQKAFLRFVTSCSRPPLLGFQYLDPKLCIQMAGSVQDEAAQERLPSASTCINLLKLPPYRSATVIRDKLLYAVRNVAGFDLS
ncbi:hypothetical protein WJX75_002372 [Coccomyxa subellipsoidea]|uniref:HECT-type E3 ubiquitin transferase n=1 Tax=Coccomyxa subellipsoidea TaxID=248742 RepID=A0ABR2YTF7_9CHLO